MKFVRAAAILAGTADLGFAALFVLKPGAFHAELNPAIYAQWVGFAFLASAIVLFIVASDVARYLPVLYVNIVVRALAALVTFIYITHFTLFIATLPSQGGLVAILVAAVIYDLKLTGGEPAAEAAKKLLGERKPVVKAAKPGAKPAAKASPAAKPAGKPAPKPAAKSAQKKPAPKDAGG